MNDSFDLGASFQLPSLITIVANTRRRIFRDNPDTDIYGANLYSRYLKSKQRQAEVTSIGKKTELTHANTLTA